MVTPYHRSHRNFKATLPMRPCLFVVVHAWKQEGSDGSAEEMKLLADTKSEMGLTGDWLNPGGDSGMFPDASSKIDGSNSWRVHIEKYHPWN
jgi:hypothetical protein